MKKFIFALIIIALYQNWHKFSPAQPDASTVAVKHEQVILYATSWCGYCKKTRQLLADNHIEYVEYDVETSEEGRSQHEQLGGGVPVLDIKGTIVHGYSEEKILSTLRNMQLM